MCMCVWYEYVVCMYVWYEAVVCACAVCVCCVYMVCVVYTLETETRTLYMLSTCSATELYPGLERVHVDQFSHPGNGGNSVSVGLRAWWGECLPKGITHLS